MTLEKEVRDHLAKVFGITTSGITEIRDQTVITDGRNADDLLAITHEKMNEYIGSEETFLRAWEISCAKAYSELHPPVGIIKSHEAGVPEGGHEQENVEVISTQPKKNAKKTTSK